MKLALTFALAGIAAIAIAGRVPMAKLALAAGLPQLAAPLLSAPDVRGVAHYLAREFAKADADFREAGRGSTYNRALSLATTGALPLSVAYFDAVLFANPADSQARENRNIVNALIPPTLGEANAAGRIAATVIGTSGGSPVEEIKRLGKPLDAGRRVADDEWLESLPDDPAEFLRLRLEAEQKRRISMGLTAPEVGDPW